MNKLFETFIVEDEPEPLNSLIGELAVFDKIIKVKAIARTYEEARQIILTQEFDLSILDKNLDEGYTCFDLIKNSNIENFGIIALNSQNPSFSLDTLGLFKVLPTYILKPYVPNNVGDFIKRLNEIELIQQHEKTDKLRNFVLNLGSKGEKIVEDIKNILFIEGAGKYCNYYIFENGKINITKNVSGTVDEQIALLNDDQMFLRVHKSYIVNTHKIKLAKKDKGTTGWLSFTDAEYNEKTNPYVARYSTEHENFERLLKRTGFSKLS